MSTTKIFWLILICGLAVFTVYFAPNLQETYITLFPQQENVITSTLEKLQARDLWYVEVHQIQWMAEETPLGTNMYAKVDLDQTITHNLIERYDQIEEIQCPIEANQEGYVRNVSCHPLYFNNWQVSPNAVSSLPEGTYKVTNDKGEHLWNLHIYRTTQG